MRILIVHNKYQQKGGEDKVFEQEWQLLKSRGEAVETLLVSNDEIKTFGDKLKAALNVTWSDWGVAAVKKAVEDFKPDIVHVHNFFPLLSPAIFHWLNNQGIPTVLTLHNYRIVCPSATLLVNGRVDEGSISKSSYRLVLKKIYRNSYIGSYLLARMVERHKKIGTWENKVDMFIALTEFAKRKFVESGIPGDRIIVKPNFVGHVDGLAFNTKREGALFVGRISKEKGVDTLIKAWEGVGYPLRIVGGGATEEHKELAGHNIEFVGEVSSDQIPEIMQQAKFLVMPSECYEGFPLVLVEAYANGLPVIASDIGSLSELIVEGETGYKFSPGDERSLREAVEKMLSSLPRIHDMSVNAFNRAKNIYNAESNYKQLMEIYQVAIERSSGV